jgi:hypothetical protein
VPPLFRLASWLACLTAVLLAPASAEAGGWTRDAGGVFARGGAGFFFGEQRLLVSETAGAGRFRQIAAELYGEVGLGHALEVDASLRWVDNAQQLPAGDRHNRGMEELEVILKWGALRDAVALAFLVGGRLALYEPVELAQLEAGRPERGPGGADVIVGASLGRSFHPTPAWLNVDLLHRIRVGSASSGLLLRGEAGHQLVGPLTGAATLELQPAFGRDIDRADGDPRPVPTVLGLGAKLLVSVAAGFGALAEVMWFPDVMNDGPGVRLGVSVTYQR